MAKRNINTPPETRPSVAGLWFKLRAKSMPEAVSRRVPLPSHARERKVAGDHARRHQWFV